MSDVNNFSTSKNIKKDIFEINESIELNNLTIDIDKKYKYINFQLDLLRQVTRKNLINIKINIEIECLDTLRIFLEINSFETNLDQVYYYYLYKIKSYFELKVKLLNRENLRNLFLKYWDHKENLNALKINSQYVAKFRLKNRS